MTPEAVQYNVDQPRVKVSKELPPSLKQIFGGKGAEVAGMLEKIEKEAIGGKILFQENFDRKGRLVRVRVGLLSGEVMLWGVDLMKGKTTIYFGKEMLEVGAGLAGISRQKRDFGVTCFGFDEKTDREGDYYKTLINLKEAADGSSLEEVGVSRRGPLFEHRTFQAGGLTKDSFFR